MLQRPILIDSAREKQIARWRVHVKGESIGLLNGAWCEDIDTPRQYLDNKGLCIVHETRGDGCRTHNPPYCYIMIPFEAIISSPKQFNQYFATTGHRKR